MTERAPLPPAIQTLSTENTERLRKRYPDLQMSLAGCRTCQGTRRYRIRTGETITENECDCESQFKLHRALLNAGIDLHYQRLSWTDCVAIPASAEGCALDYYDHASGYAASGIGLLFHGAKGTGKTLLITLLMKMLLGGGFDVQFITFQELIDTYTQSWRDAEEKAWFEKRVRNAGILGIDDVGRESKGRMEIVESMFDHIVRARVSASRPTLITTNRSLEELRTFYRSNVVSLLDESSIKHEFTGDDFRPTLNVRKIADARAGIVRPITLD